MNKDLNQYIGHKNAWNRMANRPEMDINNLSNDDKTHLVLCLENDLSPENVSCDGERSRTEVERMTAYYNRCLTQLMGL